MIFRSTVILLFFLFSISLIASKPMGKELSFYGKDALGKVEKGEIVRSIRRGDRTIGLYGYKSGSVSPLVNSNKEEDGESFSEQIEAKKYGKVKFSEVKVTLFQHLEDADQKHLLKFYKWQDLKDKNWKVTILNFMFLK